MIKIKGLLSLLIIIMLVSACGQSNSNTNGDSLDNSPNQGNESESVDNDTNGNNDQGSSNEASEKESSDKNEEGEDQMILESDLEYSVQLHEDGSSLIVQMKLVNVGEQTKRLEFSSGHQFDVVIRDDHGEIIYDFAEDRVFTQAFITEELAPGEELIFEDTWTDMDPSVSPLQISTKLNIYQLDGQSLPGEPFQLEKTWSSEE
ncbi:BsuPI-related putative proteinase inhibitor [Salipaludibacillus keqinensis]|nr:BsuPI-related putative proteinase inhibitor [Salipaludibacillus keqinensis]